MMKLLLLALLNTFVSKALMRGISKQKPQHEWRALDAPITGIPCEDRPKFFTSSPQSGHMTAVLEPKAGSLTACGSVVKSRNGTRQLGPVKRNKLVRRRKECQPPKLVNSLPTRLRRRILQIWEERDPKGDCWQQQRRTRLILLNLPPALRRSIRPSALRCALPHFIDRLEWDLQYVKKQLHLLKEHDISVESFDMPPPSLFRRYQLMEKLRKSNQL